MDTLRVSGENQKCKLQFFSFSFLYSFLYMLKFHSRRTKKKKWKERKVEKRMALKTDFILEKNQLVQKKFRTKNLLVNRVWHKNQMLKTMKFLYTWKYIVYFFFLIMWSWIVYQTNLFCGCLQRKTTTVFWRK